MKKTKKKFHVIGITGTNGAGKDTVVDYLVGFYRVKHFSVSGLIGEEGPPEDRDALRALGNTLREEHGPDYLVRTLADKAVLQKDGSFIIESLRCTGEIAYLSDRFKEQFTLIGVDACIETRYSRAFRRGTVKDKVSFEQFELQEKLESESLDRWRQNLSLCAEMVQPRFRIWNEFDLNHLRKCVKEIAREIGMKSKVR